MTPSLVLSVIALTVALGGGTAFAAHYVITSTKQYQAQRPPGARGQHGPYRSNGRSRSAGAARSRRRRRWSGPAGIANIVEVDSPHTDVPAGGSLFPTANCPAGTRVIGTGFYNSIATVDFTKAYTFFVGAAFYNDTGVTATGLHVQAICAGGAGVFGASSAVRASLRSTDLQRFEKDVAASQAGH